MLLFKGCEPLIGAASIQYANGEDWDQRQKCLYKTLKGEDLKEYFSTFVRIAQVSKCLSPQEGRGGSGGEAKRRVWGEAKRRVWGRG